MNRTDDECYTGTGPAVEVVGQVLERDALAEQLACVRQALPLPLRDCAVPSVGVATLEAERAELLAQRDELQRCLDANRLLATQAMDVLKKEREAHVETNRAMTDALLMMEEREQRDEALLRRALEALEFFRDTAICEADTAVATEAIAALRERLGEKA